MWFPWQRPLRHLDYNAVGVREFFGDSLAPAKGYKAAIRATTKENR
jgi:hypothetical protein